MNPKYHVAGDAVLKSLVKGSSFIDLTEALAPDRVGDFAFVKRALGELRAYGYVEGSQSTPVVIIYGPTMLDKHHTSIQITSKGISASQSSIKGVEETPSLQDQREAKMLEFTERSTIAAETSAASAQRANRIAWVAIWVAASAAVIAALAWILPKANGV